MSKRLKKRGVIRRVRKLSAELGYLVSVHASASTILNYAADKSNISAYDRDHHVRGVRFEEMKSSLQLSNDWFSDHIPLWCEMFKKSGLYGLTSVRALEIGSWEGLSSCFILSELPGARLVCVDTWEGADEHKSGDMADQEVLSDIEAKFDSNVARFGDRVEKFKGTSLAYFASGPLPNSFDLIYVDGSHHCDDVIVDAVRGFALLKEGGLMIFDDYMWKYYPNPILNPATAVNAFLRLKKGEYKLLFAGYQVCIQKIRREADV